MFDTDAVLIYCEKNGIYQLHKEKGNVITYYFYYGSEGFLRVTKNVKTGREVRKSLRYKNIPKFLLREDGATLYNYFTG